MRSLYRSCDVRGFLAGGCALGMLLMAGCHGTAVVDSADPRPEAEQTIRMLDAKWSETAGAHDLDGTVGFYSDDAVLLPPDEARAADKAAIRASWAGALGAFSTLSWHVDTIDVAKSGELAYLTGSWMGMAKGASVQSTGKLLEVWKKQADGQWKCVADTYNSDPAATAAQTKAG